MTNEKLVELLVRCKGDAVVTVMLEGGGQYEISHTFVMSKVVGKERIVQTIVLGAVDRADALGS